MRVTENARHGFLSLTAHTGRPDVSKIFTPQPVGASGRWWVKTARGFCLLLFKQHGDLIFLPFQQRLF